MNKQEIQAVKKWKKLPPSFFTRKDVVKITRELLGKILVTKFDDELTAGRIVEAEAYNGPHDKAAHSFDNRRTKRTEVMFAEGGVAYVYLCYGIHQMFNIVTNEQDVPNAILVRAVEPMIGIEVMLKRCGKKVQGYDITRGPGNVAKSFGLNTAHSGYSLQEDCVYIADDDHRYAESEIISTKRIGVDYAGADAALPYRFIILGNKYVSGKSSLNKISE